MSNAEVVLVNESNFMSAMLFSGRRLTIKQKEVIKLLQNKEVIITNEREIMITCGTDVKKISQYTLFDLVNRGLIFLQTEWPFSYILSSSGETIII